MREILFRGKSLNSGEWVEGYFVKYQPDSGKDEWIFGIVPEYASALYLIKVDAETVGQFTGLTDMNGVKIFEGDIIESALERFIVEWYDELAGFYLGDIDPEYQGCAILSDVNKDGIVIGNIHDNPEMLEEIK